MDIKRAREILIDHSRRPRNQVAQAPQGHFVGEARNPLCGDHVRVFVLLRAQTLEHCTLQVHGCTICAASASLMSENVRALSIGRVEQLRESLTAALAHGQSEDAWPTELIEFSAFQHLRVNPARIPCALMPWLALHSALKSNFAIVDETDPVVLP